MRLKWSYDKEYKEWYVMENLECNIYGFNITRDNIKCIYRLQDDHDSMSLNFKTIKQCKIVAQWLHDARQ